MQIDLPQDKAVVLCLVKNGDVYIDEFIDYYQKMGFAHVVILDNGSDDETVQRACYYENVTVLQTLADYKTKKVALKDALLRNFGSGKWSLLVDIDEFFQYPFMDILPLDIFLSYLNENNFTSLVSHMIDMVPDTTIGELCLNNISNIHTEEWFFDYSNIKKYMYPEESNEITNPEIHWWYGGIRETVFKTRGFCLSKHPLNYGDENLMVINGHVTGNRRVADITGLLLHYKYLGDIYNRTRRAVLEKNYFRDSKEYRIYLEKFDNEKDRSFTSPTSIKYVNHRTMIKHDLFTVSNKYQKLISKYCDTC
jgi:hypothetical protein